MVSSAAALALVPAFLFGAAGPYVREEMGFGPDVLGLAVSSYWLAMAVSGGPGGRLVQRWGTVAGLRAGALVGCVALLALALAPATGVLVAGMGLGGVASAIITPATDLAVVGQVPERWLPIAFGVKQSSLPAASLLAGVGVPALVLTVGWRWTFVAATVLARKSSSRTTPARRNSSGWLVVRPTRAVIRSIETSISGTGGPGCGSFRYSGLMHDETSLAVAMRSLSAARPNRRMSVAPTEQCSNWVLTTQPRRTCGPMTSEGTRKPSCVNSGSSSTVVGGGTWS